MMLAEPRNLRNQKNLQTQSEEKSFRYSSVVPVSNHKKTPAVTRSENG